jgi:hypothetical protein
MPIGSLTCHPSSLQVGTLPSDQGGEFSFKLSTTWFRECGIVTGVTPKGIQIEWLDWSS